MHKGKRLEPGDTIGLLSVSNPVNDEEREICIQVVEALGFRTVCGESLFGGRGYLAATDEIRARDVNRMFADPTIDGIFCVRGGEGANRLPELIDLETVRRHPKVFLGYSDVTVLHLMFGGAGELCTFYGPMPYTEFRIFCGPLRLRSPEGRSCRLPESPRCGLWCLARPKAPWWGDAFP